MEQLVGLDVSQELTHLCVVDSNGAIVWQGTCDSTPDEIAERIKMKALLATRIGLESGSLSTWHWQALNALGLPVICLDARHARAALTAAQPLSAACAGREAHSPREMKFPS